MSIDEAPWHELRGGYKMPYDPRPAVRLLRENPLHEEAWSELWDELHHQGDLGEASYAAVPLLVEACSSGPRDWRFHGLISTIETERHRRSNPPVPEWCVKEYRDAVQGARALALEDLATTTDALVVRTAVAVIALAAGCFELGAMLGHMDGSEITEWLDDRGWSPLYDAAG